MSWLQYHPTFPFTLTPLMSSLFLLSAFLAVSTWGNFLIFDLSAWNLRNTTPSRQGRARISPPGTGVTQHELGSATGQGPRWRLRYKHEPTWEQKGKLSTSSLVLVLSGSPWEPLVYQQNLEQSTSPAEVEEGQSELG